jgi:hypothetical protein
LDNVPLTKAQISALNKGLGFVPSQNRIHTNQLTDDIKRFERRLQLHYFFVNKNESNTATRKEFKHSTFKPRSTWWPRKLQASITDLCANLNQTIHKILKFKVKQHNLTRDEYNGLKELQSNKDIIIKPCDKGGGIAVLSKTKYIEKINSLILDPAVYTPTNLDNTLTIKQEADKLIQTLFTMSHLTESQAKYFTDFIPRCPVFYGIPKIHKADIPLRPIVSQINGPTKSINEIVDYYLGLVLPFVPDVLQDTTAFLQYIEAHRQNITTNTLLASLDIVSLYTNIPQDQGADWVAEFYAQTIDTHNIVSDLPLVDRSMLQELILFILHNCEFTHDNSFYKQNFGTSMGAIFSVKYANIYMYMFFKKFAESHPEWSPFCSIPRFIDDCFLLWNSSQEHFVTFVTVLNSWHHSIKFEYEISSTKLNFLDTLVVKNQDNVTIDLYKKPTDRKQYLHYTSSHPHHVKKAIPYSQALRYRRIIDDESNLKLQLTHLKSKFTTRAYPSRLVNQQVNKVLALNRSDLLTYRSKTATEADDKTFLPLIIPYHNNLGQHLHKHFFKLWSTFINSNDKINNTFGHETPQIVYKRNKTIGQTVVKAYPFKFNTDSDNLANLQSLEQEATKICNSKKCYCCTHYIPEDSFQANGQQFVLSPMFTCNSQNVIYLIKCQFCNLHYIGQTKRTLRERLNNHRSDINTKKQTAVAIHFNSPGHNLQHLKIAVVESLNNKTVQEKLNIEKNWIKTIKSYYPLGLNYYPLQR